MLDTVMNDAGANSRSYYAVPQHISGHIERPIRLIQSGLALQCDSEMNERSIFLPKGCGGLFACLRIVDRKEAPGLIFVRRHRTTACRQGVHSCGGSGATAKTRNARALRCRIDLERNNADAIVLAMTSLTPLPRCMQTSRGSGHRVKLLSDKSAGEPTQIHCRLTKPAPNPEEESSKNFGPTAPGGHLCPPWLGGGTLPETDCFGEHYSRHLVDVKGITLHIVFYAFQPESEK